MIKLFLALFQPFNLTNQNVVFCLLIQSRILHMYGGILFKHTSFTDTIFIMQPFHIIPNDRDVFEKKILKSSLYLTNFHSLMRCQCVGSFVNFFGVHFDFVFEYIESSFQSHRLMYFPYSIAVRQYCLQTKFLFRRFSVVNPPGSDDWVLSIDLARMTDRGHYECQAELQTGFS